MSRVNVLDHGYVELVDFMGNDERVANAARTSYGEGTKTVQDNQNLIDYLIRHNHLSPLEQVNFTFLVQAPIFIARQWFRHRTGKPNEYSLRYSEPIDEYFVPSVNHVRVQSKTNKQVGDSLLDVNASLGVVSQIKDITEGAKAVYRNLLDQGVCREQARTVLPVSAYTRFYWTQDLRNLLHLIKLRSAPDAQKEIQEYANALHALILPVVPYTIKSWENHVQKAVTFSLDEIQLVRKWLSDFTSSIEKDMMGHQSEQVLGNGRRFKEFWEKVGNV